MKSLLTFLLFLSAFATNGQTKSFHHSEPLSESSPEEVGLSPERLKRIDAMLQEAVAEGEIPRVVLGIVGNGKLFLALIRAEVTTVQNSLSRYSWYKRYKLSIKLMKNYKEGKETLLTLLMALVGHQG